MDERDYIRERFNDQKNYYDRKAIKYQKKWLNLSIIVILLTPIPIVVFSFISTPWYITLLVVGSSYFMTVVGGILNLLKYRELWLSYRAIEQQMLREYYHYKTQTGNYAFEDDNKRFKLFVERIEQLMAQERSRWLSDIQQQDLSKK